MSFRNVIVPMLIAIPTAAASSNGAAKDEHPWIRLAQVYRAAVQSGDVETIHAMQAPNARVWFDDKKGPGRPLDVQGKGPWAQWDDFFHAQSKQTDFVIDGDAVRFTNLETNDWLRLIERASQPYYVFYFFDANNQITGKLIRAIESKAPPPDRLDEFKAWAETHHPGLMDHLMHDGHIDPHPDKARIWKERLLEWRSAVGLPDVLGTDDDRQ